MAAARDDPRFPSIRASEIQKLLRYRYGPVLPDDDAGRDDLRILLRHKAHLSRGLRLAENLLDTCAPWLVDGERQQFLQEATQSRPPRLKADTLAKRLNLTSDVRQALNINTIGAIDLLEAERRERRLARDRERKASRRREGGRKPRSDYLQNSVSQAKPWLAEGVSRRTWYRRQRAMAQVCPQ